MIDLEVQALSEKREGLLIEVGRLVVASGFTLQRQRLMQDPHGMLLTVVVRGPPRKRRSLEAALDGYERIISFEVSPFVEGETKPHFAASRRGISDAYVPPPAPVVVPVPTAATTTPAPPETVATAIVPMPPEQRREAEPEFMLAPAPAPAPAPPPAPVAATPHVEPIALGPDEPAVEKVLSKWATDYPRIFPQLLTLEHSVADGARASSLELAGRRGGAWLFKRDYAPVAGLGLHEAIERVGLPALRALVEVDQIGDQLHIHNSPLCTEADHSGCTFFSGFLEELLGPAVLSDNLSVFAVCCRSYGADACVLALSA